MKEGLKSPLYNETLEKKDVCVRLYYSDIVKSKRRGD